MLGNTIALLTLALMLASEGKRSEPPWRYGLFTLATIVALVAVGLGPITAEAPSIGTFLSGIFGMPVSWFILSIALFFVLRPFWSKPAATPAAQLPLAADGRTLTERLNKMETTHRAIIDDYQRMLGMEARFDSALDGFKEAVRAESESLKMHLQVIEGKVEKLTERTRGSIHAIWMREQLAELSRGIRADAADLSRKVSEGQAHDHISWDSWLSVYNHWTSLTAQWWNLARFYLANARDVSFVPDHMYSKIIVDEALLTPVGGAEAVRVYKRFRIIQDQWEAVQPKLEENLILVAFSGMTEVDVRHGQPVDQG